MFTARLTLQPTYNATVSARIGRILLAALAAGVVVVLVVVLMWLTPEGVPRLRAVRQRYGSCSRVTA